MNCFIHRGQSASKPSKLLAAAAPASLPALWGPPTLSLAEKAVPRASTAARIPWRGQRPYRGVAPALASVLAGMHLPVEPYARR